MHNLQVCPTWAIRRVPITTALAPAISTPDLLISSRHPAGVQGRNPELRSPVATLPSLTVERPSTSLSQRTRSVTCKRLNKSALKYSNTTLTPLYPIHRSYNCVCLTDGAARICTTISPFYLFNLFPGLLQAIGRERVHAAGVPEGIGALKVIGCIQVQALAACVTGKSVINPLCYAP